jgi:hypothetical protein
VTLLPALSACELPPDVALADVDGDGWTWEDGDCDDRDEDVYPNAPEVCDRVDNDCDGSTDAGACTAYDLEDDEGPSVIGEGRLGRHLAAGLLDGDATPDLVPPATNGDADAICVIAGARVGEEPAQPLAEVAHCWTTSGQALDPAVAAWPGDDGPLWAGQQVAWVATSGDGLCAVNPYGQGYGLSESAFACSGAGFDFDGDGATPLGILAADPAGGVLAVAFGSRAWLVRPDDDWADGTYDAGQISGRGAITAIGGGEDLDGDGQADLLATSGTSAYLLPSRVVDGKFADLARASVSVAEPLSGVGTAGDLDGDGTAEWWATAGDALLLTSGDSGQVRARIENTGGEAGPGGDFDGDGRDDLWAMISDGDLMLLLGRADLPAVVDAWADGDLITSERDGDFGASFVAIGDENRDGYGDAWFAAPAEDTDGIVSGEVYLWRGWGLSPAW